MKTAYRKSDRNRVRLTVLALICWTSLLPAQTVRDRDHQPDRVMDTVGVKSGMVIGEVGAGTGYFTFHLAKRVGVSGKVYANDISRRALRSLNRKAGRLGFDNIETVLGRITDPLLPKKLDMVFIVNTFHDLADPVALLDKLAESLNPDAPVVIIDRDPDKIHDPNHHFMTRQELLRAIERSVLTLIRTETYLKHHNIYVVRAEKERT